MRHLLDGSASGHSGAGADEHLGLAGAVASGDESAIMLDATKNGKGHDVPAPWRRLLQFQIGIRDPVDRLRGAGAVVLADVLGHDSVIMKIELDVFDFQGMPSPC